MSAFKTAREIIPDFKKNINSYNPTNADSKAFEIGRDTNLTAYYQLISNIPKRYKNAKFSAKKDEQIPLLRAFSENFRGKTINEVSDMLIIGPVGTGKTYITCAFLNILINQQIHCKYTTEYNLLDLYFQKNFKEFNNFKEAKVLVIDEIAKRELEDWQKIHIEELLSYRYNEMLPTLIISNRNPQKIKEYVGDRVYDRLKGNNVKVVVLNFPSIRQEDG